MNREPMIYWRNVPKFLLDLVIKFGTALLMFGLIYMAKSGSF